MAEPLAKSRVSGAYRLVRGGREVVRGGAKIKTTHVPWVIEF